MTENRSIRPMVCGALRSRRPGGFQRHTNLVLVHLRCHLHPPRQKNFRSAVNDRSFILSRTDPSIKCTEAPRPHLFAGRIWVNSASRTRKTMIAGLLCAALAWPAALAADAALATAVATSFAPVRGLIADFATDAEVGANEGLEGVVPAGKRARSRETGSEHRGDPLSQPRVGSPETWGAIRSTGATESGLPQLWPNEAMAKENSAIEAPDESTCRPQGLTARAPVT